MPAIKQKEGFYVFFDPILKKVFITNFMNLVMSACKRKVHCVNELRYAVISVTEKSPIKENFDHTIVWIHGDSNRISITTVSADNSKISAAQPRGLQYTRKPLN